MKVFPNWSVPLEPSTGDYMRILVISAPFPQYSFVLDETLRLSNESVEVHVARYVPMESKNTDLFIGDVNVHTLNMRSALSFLIKSIPGMMQTFPLGLLSPKAIASTVPFSRFIANLVRKYNIDIIHAHFTYPEGFAGFLARHMVKVPFVLTLHGYDILTEPSIKYGVRLEKRFDTMVRKVFAEVDKVFAASEYVYEAAISAGCPQERLVLMPNGVDIERFNQSLNGSLVRKVLGIADRPVVFTLRWHEPKNGIEYLIRAIPHVLREVPEAVFVIGSDGPLMGYHKILAQNLGVDDHVLFVGRIPRMDLPSYYAASDVFVIPSVVEAFGLVTVEAMACGKPVIGTNVGGIPEIIVDGVSGFLTEPKNPEKIAEKVILLLKSPKLRKKMGRNGRKIAEEKFDIKKRVHKILSVYNQLL